MLIRGATVVIDNAAEATIYGLEVDLEAQPTDALFLRGSLGLMENEFDEWSDDIGDYTDRKLRNSPEMTANFLAAYTADLGGNGSLRPWAEVQYQDEMFLDGENTPQLKTPSRTLVNAGIAWASPGDRWEVEAHVTNATDERVLDGGFNVLNVLRLHGRLLQSAAPLLADAALPIRVNTGCESCAAAAFAGPVLASRPRGLIK